MHTNIEKAYYTEKGGEGEGLVLSCHACKSCIHIHIIYMYIYVYKYICTNLRPPHSLCKNVEYIVYGVDMYST